VKIEAALDDHRSILAVFAHPDDEVFRCGGTLALLARRGIRVHVLTFTRGQAGSCGEPPVCSRQELGVVRTGELYCSCQALGLETPDVLDYEDGDLENVSQEEGIAQIYRRIQAIRPQLLLTWPPDGLSGHPDHIAVSRWTSAAFQLARKDGDAAPKALYHLAVPVSVARLLDLKQLRALPDEEIHIRVNVQSVWEQKIAAIHCHRTQAGESPILHAPIERQRLFLGQEHFSQALASQPENLLYELYQEQLTTGGE